MNWRFYKNRNNWAALLILTLGMLLIVYLSWKSNPNLKELTFIPDWLAGWADHESNSCRRTAIPFIGLGLYTSVNLLYRRLTALYYWIFAWLIMVLVVGIAEAGQLFFPSRTPDLRDVIWGGLGAGVGLVVPLLTWQMFTMIKAIDYESKKN